MTVIDSSQNANPGVGQSWFHHPFVWFVFALPFSAVLFGAVMIISANYHPDDLVVDDYYKEGMAINQQLDLDTVARNLELGAEVTISAIDGVQLEVASNASVIQLAIFHVTDKSQDIVVPLERFAQHRYASDSPLAMQVSKMLETDGVWYLELKDEETRWRLRQRVISPAAKISFAYLSGPALSGPAK